MTRARCKAALGWLIVVATAKVCSSAVNTGVPLDPATAYEHFLKGNELYTGRDLESAAREYYTALRYDPTHADILCNLGSVLQDLGDIRKSKAAYKRAVEANPYHAVANFNLGLLMHDEDLQGAIDHYQAAVEMDPTMADAWSNLGAAQQAQDDYEEALLSYQQALTLFAAQDPELEVYGPAVAMMHYYLSIALWNVPESLCAEGACKQQRIEHLRQCLMVQPDHALCEHNLRSELGDPAASTASEEYVKILFDDYAHTFDESLQGLGYSAPQVLWEAIQGVEADKKYGVVFDAGCGTGLCGPLLRGSAVKLVGADLSGLMLDRAEEKGVYDDLIEGEIVQVMQHRTAEGERAGLVVAADVLVYIGDLGGFLSAAWEYLAPGGLLAVSTEMAASGDCHADKGCKGWVLRPSGRFAHTKDYLSSAGIGAGFHLEVHQEGSTRAERGEPVPGHLAVFRKPDSEGLGGDSGDSGDTRAGSDEL